jgi:hypothetical protein
MSSTVQSLEDRLKERAKQKLTNEIRPLFQAIVKFIHGRTGCMSGVYSLNPTDKKTYYEMAAQDALYRILEKMVEHLLPERESMEIGQFMQNVEAVLGTDKPADSA